LKNIKKKLNFNQKISCNALIIVRQIALPSDANGATVVQPE